MFSKIYIVGYIHYIYIYIYTKAYAWQRLEKEHLKKKARRDGETGKHRLNEM